MHAIFEKKAFISDMDGVIYHGNHLLAGVPQFVTWLKDNEKRFLFLTNSSERSPRELREKLARLGVEVGEENFYTSALATASFLSSQTPNSSAFVVGEAGLINALYEAGISINDVDPEYVVIGETRTYSYERVEHAVHLIRRGAKLIGTNPDITGPTEKGIVPATGSLIAPIEMASGCKAYFVGKPNPLIMRHALKKLGARREETCIIGDRVDTDVRSGVESEIDTVLVFSGVAQPDDLCKFAYRPTYTFTDMEEMMTLDQHKK